MIKPEQKKASKEFINYLKDTQKMPLSQTQPSKPKQTGPESQNPVKKYYGPIEGDFSKIGCTYVLQNDSLIKKSPYGNQRAQQDHNQISHQNVQIEDVEVIKEIAKLEYLEKKGYLKPQEMQRLQLLRGHSSNSNPIITEKQPKKLQNVYSPDKKMRNLQSYEFDHENIDPNMYYQEFLSPKKQISSMKFLSQQIHQPRNNFEQQQYQIPYLPNHGNLNYGNQGYMSHSNYY